jgi:glycosyltransferase involved in cell wall biosynthesis
MRILMVHGRYALRGGEDEVFEAERDLLRAHGHTVTEYIRDNKNIAGARPWAVGLRTIWSRQDYHDVRAALRETRAEIVAVHNFFPLISPAVFYAARAEGVPAVQTLHNFRLVCPGALLLREGAICEQCVGLPVALPGIRHGCYRGSSVLTAGVAGMISVHKALGTWQNAVSRYIALNPAMRLKMIEGGFPADRIVVKPNFREDPGIGHGTGGYLLFVGRLSVEKGVSVLLRAWRQARAAGALQGLELRIAGTGPEELSLKAQAGEGVVFLGHQPRAQVLDLMKNAAALVFPSIWYEGFPLVPIEALACGTPLIASDLGAMSSVVEDRINGRLFPPGDVEVLARILSSWTPTRQARLAARESYEKTYTPERNYQKMMDIYSSVLASHTGK